MIAEFSQNRKVSMLSSNSLDHPDDQPVEQLNKGDDAEPKAQTKQAANVGHEVSFGHSSGRLIF